MDEIVGKGKVSGETSKDVEKKGCELFNSGRVKKEMETDRRDYFVVQGDTEEHSVIHDKTKDEWFCTCRYWTLKQKTCSHIFAAKLLTGSDSGK